MIENSEQCKEFTDHLACHRHNSDFQDNSTFFQVPTLDLLLLSHSRNKTLHNLCISVHLGFSNFHRRGRLECMIKNITNSAAPN